jgi:hypothetical protein
MILINELKDFINKYNGQYPDFNNNSKALCIDLFRFYCQEVLHIPQMAVITSAWQLLDRWTYKKEYIGNAFPNRGDVIIWGPRLEGRGHIAIFLEGNNHDFISFEGNSLLKDDGSVTGIIKHNYNGVLGWIWKD